MRRASTIQSPTHHGPLPTHGSAEKSSLHPILQAALQCADVQLEEELVRYRRQRALGKASYSPRPLAQRQVARALNLMPTQVVAEPLPSPTTDLDGFHPTATVPPLAAIATPAEPDAADSSSLELKELAKQYAAQVATESDLTASLHGGPDDYLESSEELLRTLAQEQSQVEAEQGFMQSLLTPLGVGSMLLLLMSSALFGFVIMNPSSVSQLFANRQSQSGASGNPTASVSPSNAPSAAPQPNLATQEFPELSLGNLGAIPPDEGAVSGAGPAVPQANTAPKTANLGVSGIGRTPPAATVPVVPTAPQVSDSGAESAPAGDVPSPRKLAPAPRYNPPPARTYTPTAPSYSPPRQRYSPPQRSYNPPPPVRTYTPPDLRPIPVAPKPAPVAPLRDRTPLPPVPAPAANTAPTPTRQSTYKVVTPYTSDKTLEDYRGKVPDAYVKNYSDGAKVQFGAYQDEAAAKTQVEQLRQQGIPAEVYKP